MNKSKTFLAKLFKKKEIKQKDKRDSIADFLSSLVISIAICVVITIFIATPNQVEGISMSPNFETGDIIITNKLSSWLGGSDFGKSIGLDYQRGDVIVFQKPNHDDLIKRIIGLPGEKISIRDGKIHINGRLLEEDYLNDSIITNGGNYITSDGREKIILDNTYIVMGDNRTQSHDSRFIDIGLVQREWIKGKVIFRYWPLNKFGGIGSGQFIIK